MRLQLEHLVAINCGDEQLTRGRRAPNDARPVVERQEARFIETRLEESRLAANAFENNPELSRMQLTAPAAVAQPGTKPQRVGGRGECERRQRTDEREHKRESRAAGVD